MCFSEASDLETRSSFFSVSVLHVFSQDDLQRDYLQVRMPEKKNTENTRNSQNI